MDFTSFSPPKICPGMKTEKSANLPCSFSGCAVKTPILAPASLAHFITFNSTFVTAHISISKSPLPIAGENTKEYKFPVHQFFSLLMDENLTGGATTDPNGHVFNITVTDLNGEEASGSLSVIVE